MEQFSLEKWLQDKSRKVVTRDGRPVRILCIDCGVLESQPILVEITCSGNKKVLEYYYINGTTQYKNLNLFFADEEDELTEFEKAIYLDICTIVTACDGNVYGDKELKPIVKGFAKELIDLARKELEANYYTKVLDDRMVFKSELHATDLQTAYDMGKQDALKDLPKLEKTKDYIDPTIPVMYTNAASMKTYVEYNGYKLCINDVFEKLPK